MERAAHGRHLPYSWIDKIDNLKGAAMYRFLVKQGVPPALAQTIVINTFV